MWDQDEVSNLSQSSHAQIHKSGACPHPVCVCVCHADSHYRHRPQLKLTHVLSNVLTGLWVASCWLNDFFLGVIKALLANPSGDIASCSLAQRQSQMSQNRGKLVVLYWSSLEAYLSTFRSVTWEQGGHELQLLHNTLLSSL